MLAIVRRKSTKIAETRTVPDKIIIHQPSSILLKKGEEVYSVLISIA